MIIRWWGGCSTTYLMDLFKKKVRYRIMEECRRILKSEDGRLSVVIEYNSKSRVEIPINKDGSVKWFDDNQLVGSTNEK